MSHTLTGTGVALLTPFDNDNQIDFAALAKLLDFVTQNGVNYLVVLGTTAETPTLNGDEKRAVTKFVTKQNNGKLPVILGISGNNTAEVVNAIKTTDLANIDAILSVTPYYNKPGQQGLYEHYKAIALNSPLPVVMYNVPGRTGVNMTAETTVRLAHDFGNIIAVKEASGNMRQISYILRDRPQDFLVISGDDALTMPQIAMGANGVISVAANAYPAEMSGMVNLALQGNCADAAKLHYKLIETIDLLFAEGSPAGVKAALYLRGIIQNNLRLPLIPASEPLIEKIMKFI